MTKLQTHIHTSESVCVRCVQVYMCVRELFLILWLKM